MSDQKSRYYAFLVYEDSAPEGWKKQLKDSLGCYAISPLHEPDEEDKKPHWHVIYMHSNTVTKACALKAIPSGIPANDQLIHVHHPRNYQRYLIHLDDPDKQQFDDGVLAIETLNAFPLDLTRDFTKSEMVEIRNRIFAWIRGYEIFEYADLLDSLSDAAEVDMLDYASSHTILFNTYITSRRNKAEAESD